VKKNIKKEDYYRCKRTKGKNSGITQWYQNKEKSIGDY